MKKIREWAIAVAIILALFAGGFRALDSGRYKAIKAGLTSYFVVQDLRQIDLRDGFAAVENTCGYWFVKWGSYFTCDARRTTFLDVDGRTAIRHEIAWSAYATEDEARNAAGFAEYCRMHQSEGSAIYSTDYQIYSAGKREAITGGSAVLFDEHRPSPDF